MAGQVLKKRRLVNPAKRRRNMSAKQIKYFGTKRQKAGLRNRRQNRRHISRRRNQTGIVSSAEHAAQDAIRTVERAAEDAIGSVTHAVNRGRRNVGEILTVIPANPGRKRRKSKMAATRRKNRRRNRGVSNARRRNRRGSTHRRRNTHRASNPRVVVRYRNRTRRKHPYTWTKNRSRNRSRIRNQGGNFLTGDAGAVVGILGGAAVTKMIAGFLPSNLSTGWPGYITQSIVAVVAGQVTGKMTKNSRFGNMIIIGGLVMVGLQVAADLFPQLQLPFTVSSGSTAAGTSGMGLITSSNFFVPQVNLPGSMASFVPPAAIPAPVVVPATHMAGFGAVGTSAMNSGIRRVGRLR